MPVGRRKFSDRKVEDEVKKRIVDRTNAAAQHVRTEVLRLIQRTSPFPSRVGMPPRRVSGNLVRGIIAGVIVRRDMITGFVGAKAKYAARLEFGFSGTDGKGRTISQGPRPYFRPALKKSRPRIARIMGGK